jgi:MFS transporter, DHA2 family, multidrug resistance protein
MAAWGGSGLCSLFGGSVAAALDWEWIFWLTLPVALASLLLMAGTPESKASNVAPGFDLAGLALMVLGLATLNVTVNNAAHWGWGSGRTLAGVAVSVLALVAFVLFEQRQAHPLLALSLFRRDAFDGAVLSDFLLNFCGVGSIYVLLLYVQQGRGLSPFHAGLLTLSTTVTTLASIRLGEHVGHRRGPRLPMLAGSVVAAVGVLLMTFTSIDGGAYYALVVIGFAVTGLGLGATATPSTDTAVGQAPHDLAGAAGGVYKMASSLGAAFGIAISNAVVTSITDNHTSSLDRGAAFGLMTAVIAAGLSAVVVWVAIHPRPPGAQAGAPGGDGAEHRVEHGHGRAGGAG